MKAAVAGPLHAFARRGFWVVSGEWLLTTCDRRIRYANGGVIIFVRSSFIAVLVFAVVVGSREAIDPNGVVWTFTWDRVREVVARSGRLLGIIFGAAVTSLYARFASQWSYVAGMYNQIKAAQVVARSTKSAREALTQWKAGFIEDAGDLHLAGKNGIASTIIAWSKEHDVKTEFVTHCGTRDRWNDILRVARKAHDGSRGSTAG